MKKLFFRISAAFTAAKAAFVRPEIMVSQHFNAMASMYENILNVQESGNPQMFQIGIVLPDDKKHIIATVWVGAGADSSPAKRIEQLCDEILVLRSLLKEQNSTK